MIPIRCAGRAFLIREDAKVSTPPTPTPNSLSVTPEGKVRPTQRKQLVSGGEQGWFAIRSALIGIHLSTKWH